jgi:DNA repair ATPase RecN
MREEEMYAALNAIEEMNKFLDSMSERLERVEAAVSEREERLENIGQYAGSMRQSIDGMMRSADNLHYDARDEAPGRGSEERESGKGPSDTWNHLASDIASELGQMLDESLRPIEYEIACLKRDIMSYMNRNRPERPYSRQTMVHRTINSYEIKDVPTRPWDP